MNHEQIETSVSAMHHELLALVVEDLYDHAPVGFHSLDADGRFLLINDTALNWLGYTREEVVGRLFFYDLLPPAERASFTGGFESLKTQGETKDLRFTWVRKDGSTFPIMLNATAIYDDDGPFLMSRTVVVDISIRQALEEKINQKNDELKHLNEQLYALNQTKNLFIGVVAHDLQNPITNLRLLAAKFRKTATNLTGRQQQWVEELDDTARRMGELISQTLDTSRIERDANAPHLTPLDVLPLLADILNRFTYIAERKAIRLHLMSEASEAVAHTDAACLTEIVENLISNAIKFSPFGKTVHLRVATEKETVQIIVADEGPGVPVADQPRLFGQFVTLSTRPTGGEASSGLGLFVARRYAEQLGGTLGYQDQPGAGATFVLQLPAGSGPAA